jgi:hypothetical protein
MSPDYLRGLHDALDIVTSWINGANTSDEQKLVLADVAADIRVKLPPDDPQS